MGWEATLQSHAAASYFRRMGFWRRLFGGSGVDELKPQRLDYLNEALALERQGDYEAALTSYRLALRDHPNDAPILQNKAIAFPKTRPPHEAIRHHPRGPGAPHRAAAPPPPPPPPPPSPGGRPWGAGATRCPPTSSGPPWTSGRYSRSWTARPECPPPRNRVPDPSRPGPARCAAPCSRFACVPPPIPCSRRDSFAT